VGDRFGVKRTIIVTCFLAGLAGAARGLAGNFGTLAVTMFLFGLMSWIIPVVGHKLASIWFMGQQLGRANGILSMGMMIGTTAGTMLSATILSPLLGGWQNVMFLYGGIAVVISILWLLSRGSNQPESSAGHESPVPFRQAISRVVRIKGVWILGFIMFLFMGGTQGVLGYVALYLRGIGWAPAAADGALSAMNAAAMISVVPVAALSDRVRSRKMLLATISLIVVICIALLSVVKGSMVWVVLIVEGIVRGGYMAIVITIIMEMEEVGAKYAGTAFGLVLGLSQLGGFISPPVGNSFASIGPSLPFVFWAAIAFVAVMGYYFLKEKKRKQA
jgi:NNP family nitrate/nitrite transporter-like MFS transporter